MQKTQRLLFLWKILCRTNTNLGTLFRATEEGFDPTDTRHYRAKKHPKYTKFDDEGIPTHHHDDQALTEEERDELRCVMETKKEEIQKLDGYYTLYQIFKNMHLLV